MSRETSISLWDSTLEEGETKNSDLPVKPVDVAIIGAGYTGLSTALHAALKGLTAHVVEAQHIGYGGSGRNVGLVNAAAWLPPDKVIKKLGSTYGKRFLKQFSDSPAFVYDLIEKYQIRCSLTKTGTIHVAQSPRGLKDLILRHKKWQQLGEPVDLLNFNETAQMTGTNVFLGGLHDHRAGTINPMSYCRGLARAAADSGARITTGAQVTELKRKDKLWNLTTSVGSLRAKAVVMGTNAYTDDLWPRLQKIFTTIYYMQVATEPLGKEAAHILPGRQGIWDTGKIMFSFRRDPCDRLIIGTMGRIIGSIDKGLVSRWAQKQISKYFPELNDVALEEAWHGKIAMTRNHLPSIHQLGPHFWTVIGYNGRGITTGTLFGSTMANLLTGLDPNELPLPVTQIKSVPFNNLTTRFYDMAFTVKQLYNSF